MERNGTMATVSTDKDLDSDKWGYLVCFGTILTFIAGIGHVNSFGLIYNDFIIDTHASAKSLTTAHGIFAIMLAMGGILLNILSKSRSLRFGGLIGSFIFVSGSIATIFVTNTNQLQLTFGVLQGFGFGMMVPVCYATLNYHFIRKRTTVMSICKAIQGVVLMFYPQFIRKIMLFYGLRGTLIMVSGISLHTIVGMTIMKTKSDRHRAIIKKHSPTEGDKSTKCHETEKRLCKENADEVKTRRDGNPENTPRKSRFKILEILNVKVLERPVYCNICIGQSFVNFSDLTFFILLPMLMFQYGYDQSQVAMCISVSAGADVVGRAALALLSSVTLINTRLLYYIAAMLTVVMRIGLLKDLYQDYVPAYYALTFCCVPCLLFWPIEYALKRI